MQKCLITLSFFVIFGLFLGSCSDGHHGSYWSSDQKTQNNKNSSSGSKTSQASGEQKNEPSNTSPSQGSNKSKPLNPVESDSQPVVVDSTPVKETTTDSPPEVTIVSPSEDTTETPSSQTSSSQTSSSQSSDSQTVDSKSSTTTSDPVVTSNSDTSTDSKQTNESSVESSLIQIQSTESPESAIQRILSSYPGAHYSSSSPQETLFYGTPMSATSSTLQDAKLVAQQWLSDNAQAFGQSTLELLPKEENSLKHGQILVYSYQQYLADLPVKNSLVRLLIKNVNGFPQVTYAYSKLAYPPSGGFSPINLSADQAMQAVSSLSEYADLNDYQQPKLAIYFNSQSKVKQEAIRVWKFSAKKKDPNIERDLLFFLDAADGHIVHVESQMIDVNVSGTVTGYASPGVKPDSSANPAESVELQGLTMDIQGTGNSDDTDSNGDYSIVDGGNLPQTLEGSLLGPQIKIQDDTGNDLTFSQAIANPGEVDNVVFNDSPAEITTSQVNAFYSGNLAYHFIRDRTAGILGLDNQLKLHVNMNTDSCNALYVAGTEIQFYLATSSCRNSAYSTVVAHEYGHHVVNELGLAQGAFGEGVGDTLAMLLYDVPGIGYDLFDDDDYVRNAATADMQYPCSGEIHTCGMVLSGIFWEIRQHLGLSDTQQLFVDWLQATAGGSGSNSAYPTTAVEVLTVDDDDANLENGTPNEDVICDAFEDHGIACPEFLSFSLGGVPKVVLPGSTPTVTMVVSAGLSNPLDNTGILYYRIDGGAWTQVLMTRTSANQYSVDLPVLEEGQKIEFYFTAQTAAGTVISYPSGGASNPLVALAESPALSSDSIRIPRGASLIKSPEFRAGGANRRLYILPEYNSPGLYSFESGDYTNRDLISTQLPQGFSVGSQSLFYIQSESTNDMVFTNQSRTRVYYATKTSGDIVVDPKFCGDFVNIIAIHLTAISGTLDRLVVADQGADKVYSYIIDTSDPSLCTNEESMNIVDPQWITAPIFGAGPTYIYVGSRKTDELRVNRIQTSDMSSLSGAQILSTNPDAHFGGVLYDTVQTELLVSVEAANDSTYGDDYVRYYDADFSSTGTFSTCRSPDKIEQDHYGYIYVFCKNAKSVEVRDTADSFNVLARFSGGNHPKMMSAVADGSNRYIAILQTDNRIYLHKFAQAAASPLQVATSSYVHLPEVVNDMSVFGVSHELYLVGNEGNFVSKIDLSAQSISDTLHLPLSVNSMVAQSSSIMHFVSSDSNTAYSLEKIVTDNWRLRHYDVGTRPIKIGYRTNRLYVLNKGSDTLSIIDTANDAVLDNFATGQNPVDFDFNTSAQQLWVANRDSQSFSTYDINPADPESFMGTNTLGFEPNKVVYQSSDNTLYFGGQTSVAVINQIDFSSVATKNLPAFFTDMKPITNGVVVSSSSGLDLHDVTRSTFTQTQLSSSPDFLATNSSDTRVAGLSNISSLWVEGTTFEVNPFTKLFNLSDYFVTYESSGSKLRVFPYSLVSSTNIPSYALSLDMVPQYASDDGSGTIWLGDSDRLEFMEINSDLQPIGIQNALLNRPTAIATWDAKDRAYVALRNINSIMIIDGTDDSTTHYSVCEAPDGLVVDTSNSQLYVMCPRSESVSVVSLDANGDPSGKSLLATDLRPSSIKINNAIDRLYVTDERSNNVLIYNTGTNALTARVTTKTDPIDMTINTADNSVYTISESSSEYTKFPGATGASPTYTNISMRGLHRTEYDSTSSHLYAISRATGEIYKDSQEFTPTNNLVGDFSPYDLGISEGQAKVFITYPDADAIRILDEGALTQTDVSVGDGPTNVYVLDSATRAYVSNASADSISVINSSTNAIAATVSSTSECEPSKMSSMDVGGTVYLYILCRNNDSVEILNTATNSLGTPISMKIVN